MKFNEFLVSKGIGEIAGLDAEKQAELYNEYNDASRKEIESAVAAKASKEELDAMKSELSDTMTKQFVALQSVLKDQGILMKRLSREESIEREASIKDKLQENKDALKSLAKGSSRDNVRFTVNKVVGDMSLAGNTTGQIPQADRNPMIGDVNERMITLLDLVASGSIGSNVKEWVYVNTPEEGAAGATAEGALKNQIDFDLVVGSQKVEKITAYITATDEMLEDVEGIESLVQNKLTTKVRLALEQSVYNGDGVSPNMNGIYTVAPAFDAGTFAASVDNANNVDVLAVAQNQIELANCPMPTAIFMNPSDVTSLLLEKVSSTDKRYIERLQLIAGTLSFDGVPVVKSTMVAAGEFLMGDFTKANVDYKKGFTVEIGYNADNFVKNFKTIRGEVRAVCYVEHNDRDCFVKGTFATAKAALETV
jgi:HK97 family phage major capsid protein